MSTESDSGNDTSSLSAVPFQYKRAKPLDLSFEKAETLQGKEFSIFSSGTAADSYRMLGSPPRSALGRYKTASLLLGHNRIAGDLHGIRALVAELLVRPEALCWLDVSHNRLTDISVDELLGFPNLRTLYVHHNDLDSWCAVQALDRLPALRSLTLQHNPVAAVSGYRTAVLFLLPRLISLDFVLVTDAERRRLPPVLVQRAVASQRKNSVRSVIENRPS